MRVPTAPDPIEPLRYPVAHSEAIVSSTRRGAGGVWLADDAGTHDAACMRCPDKPCFTFSVEEATEAPMGFLLSPDARTDVCPFGAMDWDFEDDAPTVDATKCACCGLCATRCPVGAIDLSTGAAVVCLSSELNEFFAMDDTAFYASRGELATIAAEAAPMPVGEERAVMNALRSVAKVVRSQSAIRLLARNSLLVAGMSAQLSKVGDNHSRIELAYSDGSFLGLAELEPSEGLLDALRRLTGDLAHAIASRGIDRDIVMPTIICASLPNNRTDVYNILLDVEDVLGVAVATLPVAALVACNLARCGSADVEALVDAYVSPESAVLTVSELTGVPVDVLIQAGCAPKK